MKKKKNSIILLLAILMSNSLFADNANLNNDSSWYVGLGFGLGGSNWSAAKTQTPLEILLGK